MAKIKIGNRTFEFKNGKKLNYENDILDTNYSIPEKYRNLTEKSFLITKENKLVFESIFNFTKNFFEYQDISILISGKTGTGKTMIGYYIIKKLNKLGISCKLINTLNILNDIKKTYNPNLSNEVNYINKLSNIKLLIIDDIGTEKITEWSYEKLYTIINNRYVNKKATIFTTNCDLNELTNHLSDRITSRIFGMTKKKIFKIYGKDYRLI